MGKLLRMNHPVDALEGYTKYKIMNSKTTCAFIWY